MAPNSHLPALFFAAVVVGSTLTSTAAESAPPSTNADDLIASACNHTLYYDVCISSLAGSRAADLRGLATVSLSVGAAHAKATISYARSLTKQQRKEGGVGGGDAAYVAACLSDCMEEYGDALASLHESAAALRQGSYERVEELLSGAMTNSDTCESAFSDKPGLRSPLTERNDYFFKLCSNSIAITTLLA